MKTILFLCTANSCRSQMAEGFAHMLLPKDWRVLSAGTFATGLHPVAIEVMKEAGVDISNQYSKSIAELKINEIDYVVTLCGNARESCPVFPNAKKKEHWPIADPVSVMGLADPLDGFRSVRDDIKERMGELAERLDVCHPRTI